MYNSEQNEQEILKYWDDKKVFEKSISQRDEKKPYVFYDGPPFATGLPHYGHIVASLMKDTVPRYWTMRGFRVDRKWGWDCHGLPVENIIEKELNLNSKKDIEAFGVDKFNEACRATVLKYAQEWKKTVRRMGRWVDMENDYKTMDLSYMESVWWVFKELYKKDLLYKGHKVMHVCTRCVTPLSNFEVTQGYKDVKDLTVTAKFKLTNAKEKLGLDSDVFVLAWTTTPWTLPGNVLLAVNKELDYVVARIENENFILAKDRVETVLKDKNFSIIKELKGGDLVALTYAPLFSYFKNNPNSFRVVEADFVTITEGTGVVHIAPAFGDEDYQVAKREGVPLVQHITMDGRFIEEVEDFAGHEVKPATEPTATDVEIIKWLAANGSLFSKLKVEHSYPHCWRCDTPLLSFATNSWFVKVTEIKEQLLKNNQQINWVPEHIKDGRFGLWLEGARDWAVSRNRYWGDPLPVWESEDGENTICVGSVAELEELSGVKVSDLHKHVIDKIEIKKDGKVYHRVPEVLDCWFESGSMPYGQMHYPFENKNKFEAGFPAEFIAEGQDQTRGWFYTLHILAAALTLGDKPSIPKEASVPAFRNVIVNGIVLAEDGKKMSKRLKNYPEPDILLEKYGADAMRYYLITSPVMESEALNFSETGVREMYNKVVNTLWNVVEFYQMYPVANTENLVSDHVLDQWVLAKLNELVKAVTVGMEEYHLASASRPIVEFITELSQWYVRRSRDRFKGSDAEDKAKASATLKMVLLTLSKVMAPFTPFIAEKIYLQLGGKLESVHLEIWPDYKEEKYHSTVLEHMDKARQFVEMGLALRNENKLKVRQPLAELRMNYEHFSAQLLEMMADELNVKKVGYAEAVVDGGWVAKEDGKNKVWLNTVVDEQLKKEGLAREIIRTINQMRKEQGLTINDEVEVKYFSSDISVLSAFRDCADEIQKSVLATALIFEESKLVDEQIFNVWLVKK